MKEDYFLKSLNIKRVSNRNCASLLCGDITSVCQIATDTKRRHLNITCLVGQSACVWLKYYDDFVCGTKVTVRGENLIIHFFVTSSLSEELVLHLSFFFKVLYLAVNICYPDVVAPLLQNRPIRYFTVSHNSPLEISPENKCGWCMILL